MPSQKELEEAIIANMEEDDHQTILYFKQKLKIAEEHYFMAAHELNEAADRRAKNSKLLWVNKDKLLSLFFVCAFTF